MNGMTDICAPQVSANKRWVSNMQVPTVQCTLNGSKQTVVYLNMNVPVYLYMYTWSVGTFTLKCPSNGSKHTVGIYSAGTNCAVHCRAP